MANMYVWQFVTGLSEARLESSDIAFMVPDKTTFGVVRRCTSAYDYLLGVVDTAYQ
jgi:hypothetical protein